MLSIAAAGCNKKRPPEPFQFDGQPLKLVNGSKQEWSHVDVVINGYFHVASDSIPPGGRLDAPLNMFVTGFGQRFDFKRIQIRDVRLTAKLPGGQPLEVKKEFVVRGLAGALSGGKR